MSTAYSFVLFEVSALPFDLEVRNETARIRSAY